jgi:hypothetical protein
MGSRIGDFRTDRQKRQQSVAGGSNYDAGGYMGGALTGGASSSNGSVAGDNMLQNPTTQQRETTNQNQTQNQTTSSSMTQDTNTTGTSTEVMAEDQLRSLQSVSDPVLGLVDQAAAALPGNSTLNTTDLGREMTIAAIMDQIMGYDPTAIMQGAQANVQGLNRQLMEDVLPQITGAVEASGTSNNALGGLLASDAAARTAEAGGRVMEEARANSMQEFLNMIQQATGAAAGGSARAGAINDLVGAAKGTVDAGGVSNTGVSSGTQTMQESVAGTSEGTTDTTTNTNTNRSLDEYSAVDASTADNIGKVDPLAKMALAQSMLSPFQTMQDMFGQWSTGSQSMNQARQQSSNSINALMTRLGML